MQLKLAAAIISKPRILVLTQAYDGMPEVFCCARWRPCSATARRPSCTSPTKISTWVFDGYLRLGPETQVMVDDYNSLCVTMGLAEHPLRVPLSIYGENAADQGKEP